MGFKGNTLSGNARTLFNWHFKLVCAAVLVSAFCVTPASAETYRWLDKEGKVHFGSAVPAEYADQPYDVMSKSGLVLRRVEPSSQSPEVKAAAEKKEVESQKQIQARQEQSDRLLLIKFQSEEAIQKALELELEQVGYDSMLINKSYANTNAAIIDKVRLAADQQRAGIAVSDEQTKELRKLYRSLEIDKSKLAAMDDREEDVKASFNAILVRYKELAQKYNDEPGEISEEPAEPDNPETSDKEQS